MEVVKESLMGVSCSAAYPPPLQAVGLEVMTDTLASVVIPCKNSAPFLVECIESALSQTYREFELLVVNDHSTDETAEIIAHYARLDPRVRHLTLRGRTGAAAARNLAIAEAQGRYLAFLDSDDAWRPNKLEVQIEYMQSTGAAFCYSGYHVRFGNSTSSPTRVRVPERMDYQQLLANTAVACLTVVLDLEQVGKRYMPPLKRRQDYGLWFDILRDGFDACGIDEPLAILRRRRGSLSSNKAKAAASTWLLYRRHERLPLAYATWMWSSYVRRACFKYARALVG